MSSSNPYGVSGEQPEYLTSSPAEEPSGAGPRRRGRYAVVGGVAVVAVAAIGAGAWGVAQFLSGGGPGAASVLPDTVLAYASVDLDPSAAQKVEAIKTIKKFPAISDKLDLGSQDDIRRWFFTEIQSGDECKGLDYEHDVEPWIGDKLAIAALPNDDHVADPVFALQVKDQGKAETGIAAIFRACDEGEHYGLAFRDGYALLAETDTVAKAAAATADGHALADSSAYQDAMAEVGELGVVSMYLAPDGPKALSKGYGGFMGLSSNSGDDSAKLDEQFKDFKGAAATIRFKDGGFELAAAGKGMPALARASKSEDVSLGDLPETTVAAFGLALPDGWVDELESQLKDTIGAGNYDRAIRQAEAQTGLELPDDIAALFGKGLVVAVDGSTDFEALSSSEDPSDLKAGIRIQGDEAEVRRVVEALEKAATGGQSDIVKISAKDGRVAIGTNEAYLDSLLAGGSLGDGSAFQKSVAEADKANLLFFVDFDAADHWLDRVADEFSDGDKDVVANVKPLRALGMSAWNEDDTSHFVFRLATD